MINQKELEIKYKDKYNKESSINLITQLCDIHQQLGIILTVSPWTNTDRLDLRSKVIIEILKERVN